VLGTLLITMGIINLLFGAGSTAVAVQLGDLTRQIGDEHTAIEVGKVFRSISGGYLSIGDMGIGAEAQGLLKKLPPPGVSILLGVIRMGLAIVAVALGTGLVHRHRVVLHPLLVWSVISVAIGLLSVWTIGVPTARLLGELDGIMGWVVFALDLGLSIIWPCIVFAHIRRAIQSKEPLTCKDTPCR
jgi:hypothetical protein